MKLIRPAKFNEIKAQDYVVTSLQAAYHQNRFPQQLLFTGHFGTGKTTLARIIAMLLNCKQCTDAEPCGTCSSCTAILQNSSQDLIEIDAASSNSIDRIRELISDSTFLPKGKCKVFIIDEVHELTSAAANALLKILEEPPPYLYFILLTTEVQKILNTIKSRCQWYRFNAIPEISIKQFVVNISNFPLEEQTSTLIARLANGSLRDAKMLVEKLESGTSYDNLLASSLPNVVGLINGLTVKSQVEVINSAKDQLTAGFTAVEINRALTDALVQLLKWQETKKDFAVDPRIRTLYDTTIDKTRIIKWIKRLCSEDRYLYNSTRTVQAEYLLTILLLELIWSENGK